ncbi:phage major capsid protein [Fusobacterium sp. IOR10]|uniref:phage major capsid protein n=1 Tax=Fusobacterium sp. IOR10 TaxID=2665157 RepID=UPI0013D70EFC|nr:phage major capsid protein [Fusobacterium sp. IOR10]
MGLAELRAELARKTEEMRKKIEARDVEGAKGIKVEIEQVKSLISLLEEQELREKEFLINKKVVAPETGKKEISEMRSITKLMLNNPEKYPISEEERAVVKTDGNAAVLPKQFIKELIEIRKGFGSLRGYCDIIPVTKDEGTMPVIDLDQNELKEIAEGDNIIEGSLITTDIPFKCAKHGLIQTLSSELVEDAEIQIENMCKKNFSELSARLDNEKILKIIKNNAVAVVGAGYEDLNNVMDKALPAYKNSLVTLTNLTGYAYLKNLKDKQDRPLNLVTEKDGKYYYNSKELLTVDDALLAPTSGKNKIFYSLSFKEAVKVAERSKITVAKSGEAGFTTDTIKLRVLERVGFVKGITRSIKKLEF